MPKLGSAYIDVRADRSSLGTDLDKAESQTKTAAGGMEAAIGKVSFAALAASAVTLGAVVTSAVADGIRSFSELERKILRTESIIRATGNAANLSSREMVDLAKQLDMATLNDRDAILDAINAMQTFKSVSGQTFERSIELAVDLAEVMGTDLRSQVVQLGKALEDPKTGLSALRRVGVSFTDQQKEQITTLTESNRVLEAQSLILDAIAQQVGGAAEGAAGGLSGKVDTLNYRWREFKETLATATGAIDATARAIDVLSSSLEAMSKWVRGPSPAEEIAEQIDRIQKALANNAGNDAFLNGPVGQQMQRQLEGYIEALDALRNPAGDTYSADYGGAIDTGGIGGDSGAGSGEGEGGGPGGKYLFGGEGYKNLWLAQAEERYEILSRQYELESELENSRIEDAKVLQADFWQWRINGDIEAEELSNEILQWRVAEQKRLLMESYKNMKNAFALTATLNKEAFEAYKVYQTGETIVTGIAAAVKAWEAGMSTGGPWAPYVAAAYAASSLAWTGAQVAAIQSASFGGGGGSGSAPSGGGAIGTYRADPVTGIFEQEAKESRGTLTINIHGDFIGDESFIDNLVDKINDAEDRDVVINTSRSIRA